MTLETLIPLDKYYTPLSNGSILEKLYVQGQFFLAPALHLFGAKPVSLIKAKYDSSAARYNYKIDKMSDTEFNQPEEPVMPLNIRANERAAIVGCKRRPVILISQTVDRWHDNNRKSEECYVVAPVYSFSGHDKSVNYSPKFIERIKAYGYNTFFYLPYSKIPQVDEGFVKFDRIQVLHKDALKHMPISLSDEALDALLLWLRCFLGEQLENISEDLFLYQSLAMDALKKSGAI